MTSNKISLLVLQIFRYKIQPRDHNKDKVILQFTNIFEKKSPCKPDRESFVNKLIERLSPKNICEPLVFIGTSNSKVIITTMQKLSFILCERFVKKRDKIVKII